MDINDKDEWTQIVASLGDHELRAERDRLINSIQHLKRSNDELEEFVKDDEELQEVIDDNNKVIGNQEMRISVLKAEIEKRGISHEQEESSGPKIEEITDDTNNATQTAPQETSEPPADDGETVIHL
ncbi:hypothetical protein CJU89_6895 [Yarrowia sp. B02]|nr:hypothetical protein CJU89_6895 [Yarrowia sp. B02]